MLQYRAMSIDDYDAVHALFRQQPGITLRDADSREMTARYLARNPGLSLVASIDDRVVGCVMCGHDGRRGLLQHLVVAEPERGQGIARQLVEQCVTSLGQLGIAKSYVDVQVSNHEAQAFWAHMGWQKRTDFLRWSFISNGARNA